MTKDLLKKIFSITLSVALVFTMMPMIPGAMGKAYAASEFSVTVSASPAAGGTLQGIAFFLI